MNFLRMFIWFIMNLFVNRIKLFLYYSSAGIKKSLRKRGVLPRNPFDDVVVVSYPKSGRTWVRVVLDYLGVNLAYDHDAARIAYHPTKDYNGFDVDEEKYKTKRVINIVRDPRDVAVSSYYHAVYRQQVFDGTFSEFIRSEKFGLRKILDFQSKWLDAASIAKDFKLIRYEELHKDSVSAFKSILKFLNNGDISEAKLRKTIEMFSFENMKAYEKSGAFRMKYGKILKPKDAKNENSYKVRKGKVGGYKEIFSKNDIQYCDSLIDKYGLDYYKK